MNLRSLLVSLLCFSAHVFAKLPEIPENVPEANIVHAGKSDGIALVGFASAKKVQEYLRPYGYTAKTFLGKAMITISVTLNDDFVGCGCPKDFKEFSISVLAKTKNKERVDGEKILVPISMIVDHPQRQKSMLEKFGTIQEIGFPDLLGNRGFEVKDPAGNVILQAFTSKDLPAPTFKSDSNFSLLSLGGMIGDRRIKQTHYRIIGPTTMKYKLFNKRKDTFEFSPLSKEGKFLTQVKFNPLMWQTAALREGLAWIHVEQDFQ